MGNKMRTHAKNTCCTSSYHVGKAYVVLCRELNSIVHCGGLLAELGKRAQDPAYSISKPQRGLEWDAGSAEGSSTLRGAAAVYRKACEAGACKPRAT